MYSTDGMFKPRRSFWNSSVKPQPYSDIVILYKQEQSDNVQKLHLQKDKQLTFSMDQQNIFESCIHQSSPVLGREKGGIIARSYWPEKTSAYNAVRRNMLIRTQYIIKFSQVHILRSFNYCKGAMAMLKGKLAEVATLALLIYDISVSGALWQDKHTCKRYVQQRVYSAQLEINRTQEYLPRAVTQACFLILRQLCQSERKQPVINIPFTRLKEGQVIQASTGLPCHEFFILTEILSSLSKSMSTAFYNRERELK